MIFKNSNIKFVHLLMIIGTALLLHSCSGTKFLKEGQVLYKGSKIEFAAPDSVLNKKLLKADINKKLVPKPNKKLLGLFATRVWLYTKVEPKKEKGFKFWLKNKIGKEPVLIENIELEQKELLLEKTMQDNGYFYTDVESEVIEKKRLGTVHYKINNGAPSYIKNFNLPEIQPDLDSLFKAYNKYKVKSGDVYNLLNIQTDRNGLADYIRSEGYFDFDRSDIVYFVDTSKIQENNFNVNLVIKPPSDSGFHRKYYINDVTIYPSFTENDTNYHRVSEFKNFEFKDNYRFISRKVIAGNVFIEPDSLFSFKDYQLTTNRLVNLGIYKFVNIQYAKTAKDSLDVSIRLTPTKYQNFKSSVEISTSTLGFLGNSLAISYNNQNTGRSAIGLTLKAGAGTEFQFANRKAQLNTLDVNFGLTLSIPRRLRFKEEKLKSNTKPTTSFSISENFQKWIQYYTINDLNMGVTYKWGNPSYLKQKKAVISHELTPFNLSWLYLINTTGTFDDLITNNSQLKASFENNFILGGKYETTINTKKDETQRNYFYFINSIETSGNIAYLLGKAVKPKKTDEYQILGIPFSQFVQVNIDARNYWDINAKTKLVSRFNLGLGVTYGNREVLPYSRQFFMGGPNTIRAFPIRSIGPGNYVSTAEQNTNSVEQTGDLKLLMNLEYRWTIFKYIRGAAFVDAGNVWLLRDDPNRPGGVFKPKDFMTQIGLGTGLGLRLDLSFIAIRLDLGMPIYKPYGLDGERWIHQFPSDGFRDWRKDNWVWNFAIGYPF
jgi:outer membrane protein insertion porin family